MHYTFIICIRHYAGVINIKKYYIYHIFLCQLYQYTACFIVIQKALIYCKITRIKKIQLHIVTFFLKIFLYS